MKAIHEFDEGDSYPAAGYHEVLDEVYRIVRESGAKKVLDLGFGTAIIAKRLYQDGVEIVGVDHSLPLVEAAQEDMPNAFLVCEDYELGLPSQFMNEKFDMAIATYASYNLDDYEKRELMDEVLHHLNPGGKAIVGDLGFLTKADKRACVKENKGNKFHCDFPFIKEELRKDYPHAKWTQISKCACVIEIERP